MVRCAIWYHLYELKNVKNTHGGVLILVKFQASACNFTKINIPPWVFFAFFKLHKWYQIAQRITYIKFSVKNQKKIIIDFCWNYLKSGCLTNLGSFEWFLVFFKIFLFNSFSPGKIEKLLKIFEIPIIPQTLTINNQKTSNTKVINLQSLESLSKTL